MITIGITTCNRMKYSMSLLKSLGDDIIMSNQVIVVDNGSKEKGFKEFLEKESNRLGFEFISRDVENRDWINDEYIAKNIVIEKAEHDTILFLQDDQQYLFDKDTLDFVADCFSQTDIPSLDINTVRKSTILSNFEPRVVKIKLADQEDLWWLRTNNHFQTMGFFKKDAFDKCGPYPVDWPQERQYWGRSETWYAEKIKEYSAFINHGIYNVKSHVPLFAPVWNDPRGGYAFIRGDQRWGHYIDPIEDTYYENYSFEEYKQFLTDINRPPFAYSEIVKPRGWEYKTDQNGDQFKFSQSQAMLDGPGKEIGEE